jgi:acyl phosphate:glycerol-3-phosphate acyltransferase
VFPALTLPALGVFLIWIGTALKWRYVSLSSCLAAAALPGLVTLTFALAGAMAFATPFLISMGLLAALVIFKHRHNLQRLRAGTENKLGARIKANPPPDVKG